MSLPYSLKKVFSAVAISLGLLALCATADGKPSVARSTSKTYDFGKNTTPRYARETTRPDGKSSIVYGNTPSSTKPGRIGKPHGHTVRAADGSIDYARTPGGKRHVDKSPRQ